METGRNFSISGINSGHHNLPTNEISLKSDNVEFVRYQNFYRSPFSKWPPQYRKKIKLRICHNAKCSFKPVVSGRFGRLHNLTIIIIISCYPICEVLWWSFWKWWPVKMFRCQESIRDIIIYLHMKCRWNRTMLNFCGIVVAIFKMATGRNFIPA
jgi:hypothetical protein